MRLTEKSIGCFKYGLANFKHKVGEFQDYDAFFAYSKAVERLGEYEDTGLEPDTIEALQHENERLQVQNGVMREALNRMVDLCEQQADFENGNVCNGIDEGTVMAERYIKHVKTFISSTPTTYHNPADVVEIDRLKAQLAFITIIRDNYAAAARVIALYLKDFCDSSMTYDKMIADAARKACEAIEKRDEALKQAMKVLTSVSFRSGLGSDEDGIREAIVAIDKIGGRKDV